MVGIYKIVSPEGMVYVGQSRNIQARFVFYKTLHCKSQRKVYESLVKHGYDSHVFEVLEECSKDQLDEREKFWITKLDTFDTLHGMNLHSGGLTGATLCKETRAKISKNNSGKVRTPEMCKALGDRHRGKEVTAEQRLKISIANTGKKHTEESKARMCIAQQNRDYIASDETKKAISEKAKERHGKDKSHIMAMIKAREGKPHPNAKKVLNTETNKVYDSVMEAAKDFTGCYGTLKRSLRGAIVNKTKFVYYNA